MFGLAGFWWQLLFNVEKTPTPPDAAPDVAAAAAATVVEFVGVRCHVNCGAHDYWPRVVRFKASIAALQVGFLLQACLLSGDAGGQCRGVKGPAGV